MAPDGSLGGLPVSVPGVTNGLDGGPGAGTADATAPTLVWSDAAVPATADAETPGTPPAVTPLVNAPPWAAQLLGHYAVQSIAFQQVGTTLVTRILEIQLTEIAQVNDTLELQSHLCKHVESNRVGTLTLVAPVYLPPRRERVVFDGDTFSTTPLDVAIGYDPSLPPDCVGKAGQRVPKRAFQSWIRGTDCACAESGLPASDDCRVLDPEHDGQPGFTQHADFLSGPADVYGAIEKSSAMVAGMAQLDGRHWAQLSWHDRFAQLGCSATDCLDLTGVATGCATVRNPVQFVPLDRLDQPALGWTCELVLSRAAELFPGAGPAAPTSCP